MTNIDIVVVADRNLYINEAIFYRNILTLGEKYCVKSCDKITFHVFSKEVGYGACITEMFKEQTTSITYVEEMISANKERRKDVDDTIIITLMIVEHMSDERRIASYHIGNMPGDVYYIYEADSERGLIRRIIMED